MPLSNRSLTGFHLKMIATVTMLLDHFAAVFLVALINLAFQPTLWPSALWLREFLLFTKGHADAFIWVYDLLRNIGRFAFPLYCFLLVEGFTHTHSPARYAGRLGLFAVISEIPFDLAFQQTVVEPYYNNVFFTLLAGLLLLWTFSWLEQFLAARETSPSQSVQRLLYGVGVTALTFAACCFMYHILRSDYDVYGLLAIVVLYLLRRWPVPAFAGSVLVLSLQNSIELYALFMCVPIALYNGQRGRPVKLAFYLFYPIHLLALYITVRLLFG